MATISYVLTLYNKAIFLPHVLAGLASQRGDFDREFVFIDDGSTDDTVPVLRALTAGWSQVQIIEQVNAGPAIALNCGLGVATGDFIKPIDGDDVLLPWATAHLLEALDRTGTDVAYALMPLQRTYDVAARPGALLSAVPEPAFEFGHQPNFLRSVLSRPQTNPTSWLARTETVRRGSGCDSMVFIQDYSIELQLALYGAAVRIDEYLMATPEIAPGRLSANQAQILHDVNRALVRFLRNTPDLPRSLRRFALDRATARMWAWATRHGGKSVGSAAFRTRIAGVLGLLSPNADLEEALCKPFRDTSLIRLPLPP